ncbi:MAG: hypothetical protein E6I46_05195 [Chloroflexi bacterium]|nr:MAG: hypothetical protein E6I46_05195 [Chloroflexota bacterium]
MSGVWWLEYTGGGRRIEERARDRPRTPPGPEGLKVTVRWLRRG